MKHLNHVENRANFPGFKDPSVVSVPLLTVIAGDMAESGDVRAGAPLEVDVSHKRVGQMP